ncbi:hypothetical protein [Hydrogenophaga sp.]|uniref:hypothetical protein n=1 Tax=Hydrogenophaga sp. TaxID=1904254 RepID=UPI002731528C|nr:hypothetical protein [Hydrogenophaga sp.]MDP1684614.1 hypothetical protein [Hydrogenophaga sp.]
MQQLISGAVAHQNDLFFTTEEPPAHALTRVLPLGKYKGQSFDVLLTDTAYALWMLTSMYAKLEQKHPALFAFLISRFGPPDQTPVHNALQNRFLDEAFCLQVGLASSPRLRKVAAVLAPHTVDLAVHWQKNVVTCLEPCLAVSRYESNEKALSGGLRHLEALRAALQKEWDLLRLFGADKDLPAGPRCVPLCLSGLEFEAEGADVSYRMALGYELRAKRSDALTDFGRRLPATLAEVSESRSFRIEVKPVVGDDYPAVLRRMKTAHNNVLLVGEYNGTGATWEQLVKVFALSNISVVLLEDVERVEVPAVFKELPVRPLTQEQAEAILTQEFEAKVAALRRLVADRPEPDPRITGWIGD